MLSFSRPVIFTASFPSREVLHAWYDHTIPQLPSLPSRLNSVGAGLPGRNMNLIPVYIIMTRHVRVEERRGRAGTEINQTLVLSGRSASSSRVSDTQIAFSLLHRTVCSVPHKHSTPLFLRLSVGGDIALCCGAVRRKSSEKQKLFIMALYFCIKALSSSVLYLIRLYCNDKYSCGYAHFHLL